MELTFSNLPFTPDLGQVIYIESEYNEICNNYIRNNYEMLKSAFCQRGLEFCYLPLLAEETIKYHAPYISKENLIKFVSNVPSLDKYAIGVDNIKPSLLFTTDISISDKNGNTVFQCLPINTTENWSVASSLGELMLHIQDAQERRLRYKVQEEDCQKGFVDKLEEEENIFHRLTLNKEYGDQETPYFSHSSTELEADVSFDYESLELIESIREKIEALRNKGVNTMFLHDIIDEGEKISRLKITKDYKIFLVDYENIEIKMTTLAKAVFILFLRHSEGIVFKELMDYFTELENIYENLNDGKLDSSKCLSILRLTNPLNNSINEKCARIREAFVTRIDERLAKNYFVTGVRGEPKRITLDRSLVIWE